jgi:hypothetical protein
VKLTAVGRFALALVAVAVLSELERCGALAWLAEIRGAPRR